MARYIDARARNNASRGVDAMESSAQPSAMHPLGQLVKQAMDKQGWSTRDVEARGGPPASTTGRITNPRVPLKRPPAPETLSALATVLHLPMQRLRLAVAESLSWATADATESEPIRTVVAAMSELSDDAQESLARVVVTVSEAIRAAASPTFSEVRALVKPDSLSAPDHAWTTDDEPA